MGQRDYAEQYAPRELNSRARRTARRQAEREAKIAAGQALNATEKRAQRSAGRQAPADKANLPATDKQLAAIHLLCRKLGERAGDVSTRARASLRLTQLQRRERQTRNADDYRTTILPGKPKAKPTKYVSRSERRHGRT